MTSGLETAISAEQLETDLSSYITSSLVETISILPDIADDADMDFRIRGLFTFFRIPAGEINASFLDGQSSEVSSQPSSFLDENDHPWVELLREFVASGVALVDQDKGVEIFRDGENKLVKTERFKNIVAHIVDRQNNQHIDPEEGLFESAELVVERYLNPYI